MYTVKIATETFGYVGPTQIYLLSISGPRLTYMYDNGRTSKHWNLNSRTVFSKHQHESFLIEIAILALVSQERLLHHKHENPLFPVCRNYL